MGHQPNKRFKPAMAQQAIQETIPRNASAYSRLFFRDEGVGREEYCGGSDHEVAALPVSLGQYRAAIPAMLLHEKAQRRGGAARPSPKAFSGSLIPPLLLRRG